MSLSSSSLHLWVYLRFSGQVWAFCFIRYVSSTDLALPTTQTPNVYVFPFFSLFFFVIRKVIIIGLFPGNQRCCLLYPREKCCQKLLFTRTLEHLTSQSAVHYTKRAMQPCCAGTELCQMLHCPGVRWLATSRRGVQ